MDTNIFDFNEIVFVQTHDMTCMDAVIATLGTWWKRGYEMIYSKSWDFDFDEDIENLLLVGERIRLKEDLDEMNLLQKYHGIQVNQSPKFKNIDDLIDFIIMELESGHPITISFDEYYLPWQTKSKDDDQNRGGFLLLLKYEDNNFTFIDVHSSKKIHVLEYNVIKDGINSLGHNNSNIFSFILLDEWQHSIEWNKIIMDAVKELKTKNSYNRNAFESISLFADSILNINLDLETKGKNDYESYYFSEICTNLRDATRRRKLFSLALNYMYSVSGVDELQVVLNLMAQSASKWQLSLSLLSKAYFKNDLNNSREAKISFLLHEASAIEQTIANKIESIQIKINTVNKPNIENSIISKTINDYFYVDLCQHFNNKGIINNKFLADIDGKRGLYLNENIDNSILKKSNMEFLYLSHEINGYDNAICSSQVIEKFPQKNLTHS
ncbi:hypothetical protein D3C74_271910 [compost metagenome]